MARGCKNQEMLDEQRVNAFLHSRRNLSDFGRPMLHNKFLFHHFLNGERRSPEKGVELRSAIQNVRIPVIQ